MLQGTRWQDQRKETHRDRHVRVHTRIHDGSRHPIHLCVYSLEPCPGCRATYGDSDVWDSPSPPHRLGYLCCEHSMGLKVLSSQCVLSLVEHLAREARRKREVISPSQTRILVQAFTWDCFPVNCCQGRTGSSDGNPRNWWAEWCVLGHCGLAGTPHFPGPRDSFAENSPAEVALGQTDQRTAGQAG